MEKHVFPRGCLGEFKGVAVLPDNYIDQRLLLYVAVLNF